MTPARSRITTAATGLTALAMAVAVVGAGTLLVAALLEMASGPSLTIIDGYWVGRLPWTPIGVGMLLFGASGIVLAGAIAAWLVGGWLARVVTTAAILPVGLWWAVSPLVAFSGTALRPRPAYDPITIAYSMPETALLLVVAPAVVSALALWLDRPRPAPAASPDHRSVSGA